MDNCAEISSLSPFFTASANRCPCGGRQALALAPQGIKARVVQLAAVKLQCFRTDCICVAVFHHPRSGVVPAPLSIRRKYSASRGGYCTSFCVNCREANICNARIADMVGVGGAARPFHIIGQRQCP